MPIDNLTEAEVLTDAAERLAKNSSLINELVAKLDDAWSEGRRAKGEASPYSSSVAAFDAPFERLRIQTKAMNHDPRAVVLLEAGLPALMEATGSAVAERDAYRAKLRAIADEQRREMVPRRVPAPATEEAIRVLKLRVDALWCEAAAAINDHVKFASILDDFDAAGVAFRAAVAIDKRAAKLRLTHAAASAAVDAALGA